MYNFLCPPQKTWLHPVPPSPNPHTIRTPTCLRWKNPDAAIIWSQGPCWGLPCQIGLDDATSKIGGQNSKGITVQFGKSLVQKRVSHYHPANYFVTGGSSWFKWEYLCKMWPCPFCGNKQGSEILSVIKQVGWRFNKIVVSARCPANGDALSQCIRLYYVVAY